MKSVQKLIQLCLEPFSIFFAQLAYTDLTANGKMIQKEDIERLLRNEVKLQSYVDQAFKEELFKVAPEEKPEYNGIQLINPK